MRNLFLNDSKRKIKDLFPGASYSVNQHTLVREPFLRDKGKDKFVFNFTGEMANQYIMVPVFFHLLYAATSKCTLNKIADADEVEKKLQYLLTFHLGPNGLDTAHLKVNELFAPVFNSNAYHAQKIQTKTPRYMSQQ